MTACQPLAASDDDDRPSTPAVSNDDRKLQPHGDYCLITTPPSAAVSNDDVVMTTSTPSSAQQRRHRLPWSSASTPTQEVFFISFFLHGPNTDDYRATTTSVDGHGSHPSVDHHGGFHHH